MIMLVSGELGEGIAWGEDRTSRDTNETGDISTLKGYQRVVDIGGEIQLRSLQATKTNGVNIIFGSHTRCIGRILL